MEVSLVLLGLFLVFGPWIFIFVALKRLKEVRSNVAKLRASVERLEKDLQSTTAEKASEPEVSQAKTPTADLSQRHETAAPAAGNTSDELADVHDKSPSRETEPESERMEESGRTEFFPSQPAEALEVSLASRWLIWLGAIAISIAGIFFTAYAIEQGWLGPTTRILVGFAFGLGLAVAGEWVRRQPFQRAIASVRPNYVPLALSAAGLFSMYTAVYSGHALYDLYSSLFAFMALAAIGLFAVTISLFQGRFVALLGVLGSFLTPALVPSDAPTAWTLFLYLFAVLAACMAVVRYRGWWSLGYASIALTVGWTLIWLLSEFSPSDAPLIGTFVLAAAAVFQLARKNYPQTETPLTSPSAIPEMHPWERVGWIGLLAIGLLLFVFVRVNSYGTVSLITLAGFVLGSLYISRREKIFDLAIVLAGALVLALFALWHIPNLTEGQAWLISELIVPTELSGPILPPELRSYAAAALFFAGLFGIGGFVATWGAPRIPVFAGTSAAMPVLLFAIAYWRFLDFQLDIRWAAAALALAFINLVAAASIAKYRDRGALKIAIGIYASGVVAFLSLGFAMTLEGPWLTVALSLQLPALAWIYQRLGEPFFKTIAAIVALTVLARLVLNPSIFSYPLESNSLFGWVLYGYGIPSAAFFFSAYVFSRKTKDLLSSLLETGAVVCGVLLISFEIRVVVTGTLDGAYDSFLEQSLQSIAWLSIGYGLLVRGDHIQTGRLPVLTVGGYTLIALAALQVLALQVFFNNPTVHLISVGKWPVFDLLLLGYLIPAAFALALIPALRDRREHQFANVAGVISLFLLLVYISLEVKHWFQGEYLTLNFKSDAESYAISVAWLTFALALIGSAIILRIRALRYGSLAVLLLTALKIFVIDMSGLIGLYRVASFLGLGLCLIGIGYVYQRFVFADSTKPGGAEEARNIE